MPLVRPPLVVEASTILAYKMNEASNGGRTLTDDKAGTNTLSAGGSSEFFLTRYLPGTQLACKRGPASAEATGISHSKLASVGIVAQWQANTWTVEFWINMHSLAATCGVFGCSSSSGGAEARNYQGFVSITSAGAVSCRWQHGNEISDTVATANGVILVNTTYHVAVRKSFNGVSWDVAIFINGALSVTSAVTNNATGGTTAMNMYAFRDVKASGATLTGFMRSLRWSSTARSDADILADSLISTKLHVTDADTISHWTCAAEADHAYTDSGPYGVFLNYVQSASAWARVPGLVTDADSTGAVAPTSTNPTISHGTSVAPRSDVAALLLGELTCRIYINVSINETVRKGLFSWGKVADATQVLNVLFAAQFDVGRGLSFAWEHGVGTLTGVSSSAILPYEGGTFCLHFVRRNDPVNGGKYIGEIWVDGELFATASNLTGPTGGTSSEFTLGNYATANAYDLILDDLHVLGRAYTEFEIKTDAGLLVQAAPASDITPPVMTAVTPAAASTIATSTTDLVVDVIDAGAAGLAQVILAVESTDGAPPEIAFKSGAFQTGWSGSTSSVTNGTRYTFHRTDGWRDDPTIKLYSRDNLNNQGNFTSTLTYDFTPVVISTAGGSNFNTGFN